MTDLPKDFGGIPGYVIDLLIENGFSTVESVKAASDDDLMSISGIGAGRARLIRKAIDEIEDFAEQPDERPFKWFYGWNWINGGDGYSYVEFPEGTEISKIRYRRGSNEIGLLIRKP